MAAILANTRRKEYSTNITNFKIWPNPSSSYLYIKQSTINQQSAEVIIYDLSGVVVIKKKFRENNRMLILDISQLEQDAYALQICNSTKKFIISK
jgi:hypothetical protein